jgi:glycosyltransferase involved in cell wall biosynthesis
MDSKKEEHLKWDKFLKNVSNVLFHGLINPAKLVQAYQEMDLFVLCYKPDNENYHGENSHKILEYLSTGKVTVSSYISLYKETDLLEMEMDGVLIATIFRNVITNLAEFNSIDKMQKRRKFALENSYEMQLNRIENFCNR